MKKVLVVLLFLLHLVNSAYAFDPYSALRSPDEDWKDLAQKGRTFTRAGANSILDAAILWDASTLEKQQQALATISVWPNYQIIKEQFNYIRDHEYLIDPRDKQIKRSIPWRYPLDWCFGRAAAAARLYDQHLLPRPAKIFVFGNLNLLSPFGHAPDNTLSFWYHVAPIVRDQETNLVYVLDPALNFTQPMPMENWLKQLVELSTNREERVSICNGYGAVPFDSCSLATPEQEKQHADRLPALLPKEWEHVQSKGLQAEVLLTNKTTVPVSLNSKMIYGTIALKNGSPSVKIKDQLAIEYKAKNEEEWHTLLNVNEAAEKISKFTYFKGQNKIPVGSIFSKESRDKACVCNYYSCSCPLNSNEMNIRVVLNGNTIKQCTYIYPTQTNIINKNAYGPDIQYQFTVNATGQIETHSYTGLIEGCKN